jgi:uncharacterized membrane protein
MTTTVSPYNKRYKAWFYVLMIALVIAMVLTVVLSIDDSTAFSPQLIFTLFVTVFPLFLVIILGVAFIFGGKGPRRVRRRAPPPSSPES